ncbi:MAG: peptidylprolyl isomerase [Alphaproteobacteria bacterium]
MTVMVYGSKGSLRIQNPPRPANALALALAISLSAGFAGTVPAQNKPPTQMLGILAVVNDEPISDFDLDQRLNFIIRLSSLKDNEKTRRTLAPRVLRTLVNETLRLQEAKNQNVTVTQKEIRRALAQETTRYRLPPGQIEPFLKSRGVSMSTLIRQIKAAIGWSKLIRRKFLRTVVVSEEEIDKALARFKESLNKPRHLAAEIFLPVESSNDEAKIRQDADKIIGELNRGASFRLLARQFSQSASARHGGDIGWVRPGQLTPEVEAVLSRLPPGTVSKPIRTATGYHIVFLRERRAAVAMVSQDATVVIRQIILPVAAGAARAEWESQSSLAKTIKDTANGCADFGTISRELGSQLSGNIGRVKVKELPAQIRNLVSTIPVGVASNPERVAQGLRIIMVCDRTAKASKLPDRNRIRRTLQARHLDTRARRHLRALRQSAFIEYRALR